MQQTYGSALDLGLFLSMQGLGGILGAVGYGVAGLRVAPRRMLIGGMVLIGLTFVVIAALPPLPVLLGAAFVQGLVSGPINPLMATAMQRRTPEELRGRVIGAVVGLSLVAAPLAILPAGLLVEQFGVQPLLVGITIGFLAVVASLPFLRGLRGLDEQQEEARGS
jgi:MFS family permease